VRLPGVRNKGLIHDPDPVGHVIRPLRERRGDPRLDGVSQTVDSLILDLLDWIGPGERPYAETMDAWRTSCPRLPVWEDATDLGFIERRRRPGSPAIVAVTAAGAKHLRTSRWPAIDSKTSGHPAARSAAAPRRG
jgi:hypothetical protein